MPFEIIIDENRGPTLKIVLEEEYLVQLSLKDVAENGRNRLGKILDDEFNRIVREATLAERNRIQQGIKDLLGIRGTGRRG
ncbi:MAG: hypothetical protein GXY80_12630 [Syntrophorhabdus aromaticivorans]|jgi:hypothetical protein|uniref:Uncharacterized protein n=1 Tax=Syntrophorhabdus aromaticivorans TaxID=328301 RepID=A0A971S1N6_9BACT|nr:hypothetical protein [Syntrophorhabdus aromaticivorans]OPY66828.1 MAG: hypothetical protein A4E57_02630 [Syntrophorhabdaceae bacterium PtaU1.Bin034]